MSATTPLTRATLAARPLPHVADGGKEAKGRLLVVAGSREVPGAALLAATAAMRVGAGKVRIATSGSVAPYLGVAIPEARVIGLGEHRDGGLAHSAGRTVAEAAAEVDAVVAGPGMASGPACRPIGEALLAGDRALALDAALLRNIAPPERERASPPILLPHAGELADLLGCSREEVERDPLGSGRRAADQYSALVLVKGVTSHVVAPGGGAWTYRGGAPGLGVAGSGDVLAGIVGGLLARGAEPLTALLWAVLLHGEAGEELSRTVGPVGFRAGELAGTLPGLLAR